MVNVRIFSRFTVYIHTFRCSDMFVETTNPAFIFMRFFVDKKPCSTVTRTVFVPESIVHCTTAYTCALRLLKAEELPCAYASPVLFYTFTCAPYRRKSVDAFLKWHSLEILSFELSYITLVLRWTTLHRF